MEKPSRRRVYLVMTRAGGDAGQLLIFSRFDPIGLPGSQTPGGTIEPGESPEEAAIREATEETGLTEFEKRTLIAEDRFEGDDEDLHRFFFHLPVAQPTEDAWTHWSDNEGIEGGVGLHLRWVDLRNPEDLAPHIFAYLDRVQI